MFSYFLSSHPHLQITPRQFSPQIHILNNPKSPTAHQCAPRASAFDHRPHKQVLTPLGRCSDFPENQGAGGLGEERSPWFPSDAIETSPSFPTIRKHMTKPEKQTANDEVQMVRVYFSLFWSVRSNFSTQSITGLKRFLP